ncbi:hypothetical protein VM1G_10227 [Cytospora mali]|uniref:Magnesium transport protein CorA n=1 Tax=Cytospora mali TaxID=578113 RepID=A0A194VI15_CYTMA|nr:hypothetical protein VM1G_10227 [Valsa mali]
MANVVEQEDTEAVEAIERLLDRWNFPSDISYDVGSDGIIKHPDSDNEEVPTTWSVMRFRGLNGDYFKYDKRQVDQDEIEKDSKSETAVGTWICPKRRDLGQQPGNFVASSLVLMMFRAKDVTIGKHRSRHVYDFGQRLQDYFNSKPDVFDAIRNHPLFIYVALYECFNSWNTILYQFEDLYRQAAVDQEKRLTGVFGRSYLLNKGLINMSYCQPDVLAHQAALERLRLVNGNDRKRRILSGETRLGDMDWWELLDRVICEQEYDLDDFEKKLGFLSDRFKAALEMEFNLSGERLNLIMMWFTAFTVLFTPIAFVAAVFSIVDTDPIWFFISGSMVLVISIAICLVAYTSVITLGHRIKRNEVRGVIHRLPYQERRLGSKPFVEETQQTTSASVYLKRTLVRSTRDVTPELAKLDIGDLSEFRPQQHNQQRMFLVADIDVELGKAHSTPQCILVEERQAPP